MKKPLTAKVIAGHRAAFQERLTNELCFDLARRHTSHLLSLDCREALRQLNILNALPVRLWNGTTLKDAAADAGAAQTNGANGDQPSEAAQRQCGFAAIQSRELRSVVVGHYREIAAALVCERRQPLLPREKVVAVPECMTHDEVLWERDLSAVANDYRESVESQKCATETINEMREEIDARHRRRCVEAVSASRSPEKSLPPIAECLLQELRYQGKKRFFEKMEHAMQRYVRANVGRERWPSSRRLLGTHGITAGDWNLLAQEWLRDDKRLWKFIEAVLKRWEKDVADPRSVHRRSTVLHQTAEAHRHDWKQLAGHMDEIKAFGPTAVDVPHLLREMSFDESAKALANIEKRGSGRIRPQAKRVLGAS